MLIAGSSMREINNLQTRLSAAFEMKDLGPAKQILGMRISRDRSSCTLNLSQYFKEKVTLQGFMDADLGGDVDSTKSTSGYIYTIGGIAVSWMSRLQKCVSLSSTEAEY
uniref:Reverse transcriptase Ty1/copia-type domain-containing protein n=1 Tax=Solanum lycopersicum TaxID=4081 RepID=A0A3Q7GE39_SOLLC